MCGIFGYIGNKQALPILLDGLKSVEYRGYDSSGIAVLAPDTTIAAQKSVGLIYNECPDLFNGYFPGTIGIGHTRWATHGEPSERNAHPHRDCTGNIFLAHNGIIENYAVLKQELLSAGHEFSSDTDTEVLVHLMEEHQREHPRDLLEDVVRAALARVVGTYGLVTLSSHDPEKLVAVRNSSPLVLGVGENEYVVASDPSAVMRHTKQVIFLEDGEMAVLTPRDHHMFLGTRVQQREPEEPEWSVERAQKGGYEHFMLKEILEQPRTIEDSLRGRLVVHDGRAKLGGLVEYRDRLREVTDLLISGCGTAYFAGCVGKYLFEEYAGVRVIEELASEFRYRKPVFRKDDAFLAISQSGETADTLSALHEAKEHGVLALGIVNAVGSSIARASDAGVYQHIGPEIGVASTKAFTSQVAILSLFTLLFGRARAMSRAEGKQFAAELSRIPGLMEEYLRLNPGDVVRRLAEKYQKYGRFLYLGRKYNIPVAYEGALKLKEIAYVHAEGYGAGEMKHGAIAMFDPDKPELPAICIAPQDSVYEKMLSNIEEIRARRAPIIAIATEGDTRIQELADDVLFVPRTLEPFTPLLTVLPLQLFAYHFSVLRGLNPDRPRNLAKSVTVE